MGKETGKDSTIVIIPGLREHVADHWQTLLAATLPKVRIVPPLEHAKFSCAARVDAIQKVIEEIDGPIIVVAHSAGVVMFVHWAQKYERPIKGALLATPPDLDKPLPAGYPTKETLRLNDWFPVPCIPLRFRSIVAASENDHLAEFSSVVKMAADWQSELINIGNVGHLNPASGYGEWVEARKFINILEGIQENNLVK
jgi:predicted alpha/beta hydrolase family esterase